MSPRGAGGPSQLPKNAQLDSIYARLDEDDLLRTAALLAFDETRYPTGSEERRLAFFDVLSELRCRGTITPEDRGSILSMLRVVYMIHTRHCKLRATDVAPSGIEV